MTTARQNPLHAHCRRRPSPRLARLALPPVLALACWTATAHASVVVDRSDFDALASGVTATQILPMVDVVLGAGTTLTGFSAWLADAHPALGGDGQANGVFTSFSGRLSWYVFADALGLPGALVASGNSQPLITDTGVDKVHEFTDDIFRADVTFGAPLLLGAGGRYWFGLREGDVGDPAAADTSYIDWVATQSYDGHASYFWGNGVAHTNRFGPIDSDFALQLLGDAGHSVPEPAPAALLAVAAAAALWAARQRRRWRRGAASAALALPLLAVASPITIVNPGFEADAAADGTFQVLVPTGWQTYDPHGSINGFQTAVGVLAPQPGHGFFPGGAPQGRQVGIVSLGFGVAEAGLEQTLGSVLQPFTQYTLSLQIGNIGSGTSLPGSADGGGVDYDLSGFPGYRVELWAGDQLLVVDDNSLDGSIPEGEFRLSTLMVSTGAAPAGAGQGLRIRLINLNHDPLGEAPGVEVDFDDLRLDATALSTPLPEPGAAALLAAALGAGAASRRRRVR